jgi:1-acyl-sn-glycerol-3-phosphate acyltransferase
VSYGDRAWAVSRLWLSPLTWMFARARLYGRERIPPEGTGCVLAVNHLHWLDICVVGATSPRTIQYVTKREAFEIPIAGWYIGLHGAIGVRRGESDRDAVRHMREAAHDGRMVGLFVEGTRQKTGRPGVAQPGAAMVALQEDVPVIPAAVYGTQFWKPGNFAPCSVAAGEPIYFEGLPKGGRGYKEATAEIERRINVLFDWLADFHARGRPRGELPPI